MTAELPVGPVHPPRPDDGQCGIEEHVFRTGSKRCRCGLWAITSPAGWTYVPVVSPAAPPETSRECCDDHDRLEAPTEMPIVCSPRFYCAPVPAEETTMNDETPLRARITALLTTAPQMAYANGYVVQAVPKVALLDALAAVPSPDAPTGEPMDRWERANPDKVCPVRGCCWNNTEPCQVNGCSNPAPAAPTEPAAEAIEAIARAIEALPTRRDLGPWGIAQEAARLVRAVVSDIEQGGQ